MPHLYDKLNLTSGGTLIFNPKKSSWRLWKSCNTLI